MTKEINIGGKKVPMNASAATPIFYRQKFRRDMLLDIAPFMDGKDISDFSVYENIAYIMAKRADPDNVPDEVVDWLEQFDSATAIYDALPDIMSLWLNTQKTTTSAKKKSVRQSAK